MLPQDIQRHISGLVRERHGKRPFVPGETPIPASGKVFDEREMELAVEAVLDGWWTEGRFARSFEERFSSVLGRTHCALVNSGSSANLLALTALTSRRLGERRLKPGDEVITVAAGFPTTVAPIIQNNCMPVFVDIDPETYNTRLDLIEAAYSPKTRAVMLAHTLGNPFPAREIADWCRERGLWLIEDACDALGGTYEARPLGSFGDVSTFSFYPAHHITMGEGGAVATDDALLNKIIRSFRDWGRDCWCAPGCDNTCGCRYSWKVGDLPEGYDHKYIYSELGYNLKITDMQAAIGLAQLDKLPAFHEARRRNYAMLKELLEPVSGVLRLPEPAADADPSWFGFLMSVRDGAPFTREELVKHLNAHKIGTRLLFSGNIIKQPCLVGSDVRFRVAGSLEYSDAAMRSAFWVGCYPGLDAERLGYAADVIRKFCGERSGPWFGRKALVTGGTGFVGSALVRRLVKAGAEVTVLSSGKTPADRLDAVSGRYEFRQADITDPSAALRVMEDIRPDFVFHCAAYGAFPGQTDAEETFRVNVLGTNHLLRACERFRPKAVVSVGSWTEYGVREAEERIREEASCFPVSAYGIAKLAATLAARAWSLRTGIPLTVLRLFSVYGDFEPGHRLIPALLSSAKSGEGASLGNPDLVRDFIHAEDAVDAILAAAERQREPGRVLNVGTGTGLSIGRVAEIFLSVCASFPEPRWSNEAKRPWDVSRAVADASSAERVLGWKAKRRMEEFVKRKLEE